MNKILRVCELLEGEYGRPEWTVREPILDQLIFTILSQNTTAKNCRQAFSRLRSRFLEWKDVRQARIEDIAEAIRPAGLANTRAPRIRRILEETYYRQGNLDLEWIADLPDEEAIKCLMDFHGVGRKTAACTLMFALNRPVMPVDTHIHRIGMRLGLTPKVSAEAAHDLLQEMTPPEDIYSCHINLVTHGRQVCHAHSPECFRCVLRKECQHFAEQARPCR